MVEREDNEKSDIGRFSPRETNATPAR
jgi:hypothetical protein